METEQVWFPSGRNRMCRIYHDNETGYSYVKWGGEKFQVSFGGKSSEIPRYQVTGFLTEDKEEM